MYSEKKKSGALSGITGGTHEIMLVSFDTFRWLPAEHRIPACRQGITTAETQQLRPCHSPHVSLLVGVVSRGGCGTRRSNAHILFNVQEGP